MPKADTRYLVVIDMQEEYTGEKRNKKKFPYDREQLLHNINQKIVSYPGERVIYIKNQFFWESAKKEKKLSRGMNVVSDQIFTKRRTNAFSNSEFADFLKKNAVTELELIGIDGNYCVKQTAVAAAKLGYNVVIEEKCIGIADFSKYETSKRKMQEAGIRLH